MDTNESYTNDEYAAFEGLSFHCLNKKEAILIEIFQSSFSSSLSTPIAQHRD